MAGRRLQFWTMAWLLLGLTAGKICAGPLPAAPASLPAVHSRAQFDSLARVTNTPYPLPHLLFVVDRRSGNRVYYVNSKRFAFHRDFVNGTYLSLETGERFFEDNYLNPNRRFVMGTVAYQTPIHRWTFEFWEGDLISGPQIALAAKALKSTFFAPLAFKPNSLRQEEASADLPGLLRVLPGDIPINQDYQPLNLARTVGRIRLLPKTDENTVIAPEDIVVAPSGPVTLPPIAGLITTQPSTPLSHINLRAKSLGLPNAYIRNAAQLLKRYEGRWVLFETRPEQYLIGAATPAEIRARQAQAAVRRSLMTPRSDLTITALADLSEQRNASVVAYGAKSANLGEVRHAALAEMQVPNGFTIPFFRYQQFLQQNGLPEPIDVLLHDPRLTQDAVYRRQKLAALRAKIQAGRISEELSADILRRVRADYAGQGLFVRSSTNSEDLPNFNGAGLYTTVPNVRGEIALLEAVKTVWASVWNLEAFDARERAGIDHRKVFMAVLIQTGINADSAGVLITTDPFNSQNSGAVYVSAKRGLGIKVVEGAKVAEQLLYQPKTNAVQVLTRSGEDSLLEFDARGGVKELPITGPRVVLTDDVVLRLARVATQIKRLFAGRNQDIEWAVQNNQVYIVQSRPYIDPVPP
jgi:hypothetical protein